MTAYSRSSPLISIICAFHNEERFLNEAIDSVLDQTFKNWELLLVDDGSTDDSPKIARSSATTHQDRIIYLRHPNGENRGTSASRNLGLRRSTGRYITFLDGDDVFLPEKLEEQVTMLEQNKHIGLLCGATQYWHSWTGNPEDLEKDKIVPVGAPSGIHHPPSLLSILYPLGIGAAPCISSLLIRREAIERINGWEASFRGMYDDQALLSKIYLAETVLVADEWWDRYRRHAKSMCTISLDEGTQTLHHQRFLTWFKSYLVKQRIYNLEVWVALLRAMLPYRFPYLTPYLGCISRLYKKIRWHAKQLLSS